jgi:hypothetical protein
MVEHEFGDLLQTPRQRTVSLRDGTAQFVVAHRSRSFVHRLRSPGFADWSEYSTLQATIERSF